MSPSRAPARGYRPPRARREVLGAVLGVLAVVAVAVGLIWVFAPADESPTDSTPTFTVPTSATDTTTAIPTSTTPTSAPG